MELTLKCANCRSELDARMEHGEIVVEPCDCQTERYDSAACADGLGWDEIQSLKTAWSQRC